ncbi:glycoside hydrolase family 88 protein [Sphingobacterium wenxiniae]|uniref:Glycosyl Hydrolase Family 88 n=1 Tax=Sphingobacterium wenxiniae TaxID=683125 RepID=A0A1I6R4L3_9SPHI|nr:glycoside hydrolase family 88 protein [Sphingobacterium wenxiniae]SFS59633.1 Glycosyl Hydrolase Family 88 [Sphingobacterium wenxiniae]
MIKVKQSILAVIIAGSIGLQSCAQHKQDKAALKLSEAFVTQQLNDASKQIKYLESQIQESDIPTTFKDGKHVNWGTAWWCSGFYPGTALYLYEATGDQELLDIAKSKLKYLEKEKHNTTTHDLGFMLFCSFGNALRLTGDSSAYKEVLATGAESLASRFKESTKTIRSWDGGKNWDGQPWTYPVIIDNMMNLEFLTQVSKITGNPRYTEIAKTHANTTLKEHFRDNYSSYHVVDYNPEDGSVIAKKTAQGAFDESAWARGQAWALYGYTVMYRETKDEAYLKQARGIADFYLNHPNLPEDLVPYWDFDQDKLTSDSKYYAQKDLRDASTAAIVASALLELSLYTEGEESANYITKSEKMLESLSREPYKAAYKDNGGYILKHSVGSIPHETEVDVPLTYADYYYVEALIRYGRMLKGEEVIKQ